jgi:hypothetical protein
MPRAALPRSGQSGESIIMLVAVGVAALFVAIEIGVALTIVPIMLLLFERASLASPPLLAFAETIGPLGIILTIAVVDALIFGLCVWAARRFWVGLLFLPPAIYLAMTLGLFIGLVGGSAVVGLAS